MKAYEYETEFSIYEEAECAAFRAAQALIDANPGVWYPCGFSQVNIKPARGRFVSMLKDKNIGGTSMMGGYDIYNPAGISTQWMEAKIAGSNAFVAVLQKHGIIARTNYRID